MGRELGSRQRQEAHGEHPDRHRQQVRRRGRLQRRHRPRRPRSHEALGLAGKVPISGQDATEAGCNSIARGELTVTILKDTRKLTPLACELAGALAKGKKVAGLIPTSLPP